MHDTPAQEADRARSVGPESCGTSCTWGDLQAGILCCICLAKMSIAADVAFHDTPRQQSEAWLKSWAFTVMLLHCKAL